MNTITKYTVANGKFEKIAVFSNEFSRKLESLGTPNAMLKICGDVPKKGKEETEELEAMVSMKLSHWYDKGFYNDGFYYKPMFAGSSDIRKATSVWLRQDLIPAMGKWAMCGVDTKTMKLAVNKYMAYIGLLASASKKFEEAFGVSIDVNRIAVIPDGEVTVSDVVDMVSAEAGVTHNQARQAVINAFDGFGIIRDTLTNNESCTIRGPWIKAFVQATNFTELACFAYANGRKPEFKDFWGNSIALKDVDIILTESCFKAAKLYKSWKQYTDAFVELGHTICVCVREHAPKAKGMPYQQGQTLTGTEDDAMFFAEHAKSTVDKYSDPKEAVKLLRGNHRAAARLYPALLNEKHTKRSIQEKYTSKRNDMLGGRIPELGYNAFLAPDMVAFGEHLFGLPINGFLKAGECCCLAAEEGVVDVTRNPHLDNAHCLLNNRKDMPFAKGPTMFINIMDMVTIRLRADYDGDHVWYSQNEHLIDLVNRTYAQLKTIPIDWDVGKAEKVQITKSAICHFITGLLHGSEIGIYADTMTKMWNNAYDRDVCDWLTYAGNVLIDAAKHAAVKIVKPQAVENLGRTQLPLFAMYAKADEARPVGDYWLKERKTVSGKTLPPRCRYTGSFLDMYSKGISDIIPETLTVEGMDNTIFDPTALLIKPDRKVIPGLCKKGMFNLETKSYENAGLFQQIAFMHADEYNKLINNDNGKMHRDEWEAECKRIALEKIVSYCRDLYADKDLSNVSDDAILDAAYDNIARSIFNPSANVKEGMDTVLKQCFWNIFGDRAVRILKQNKMIEEMEEVDSDSDDDEDYDVSLLDNID